jgi:hypothetical protein
MKRSKSKRFWFGMCLLSGLLLALLSAKLGLPVMAQPTLLAPVSLPPTAEMRALEKRPAPINASVAVPDEVKVCMESSGKEFDLWGTVQDKGKTYYLLGVYWNKETSLNPLHAFDELIETDSQTGCTRLAAYDIERQPYSTYMSASAAQSLELQRYRKYITKFGGVSQLGQALKDDLEPGTTYIYTPEQIAALQQLHVALPPYQTFSSLFPAQETQP